ncbi:MAG: preprotein translocase subunit SecG [Verrucomicrobia bacterium]|nr:preprotein translocase subunit SecG [Verrucomicrobiota bacterium]
MNIVIGILLGLDCLVALLMCLIILMQRPKSEGLGAAFGGGVTENIFGAQTSNVLTQITSWFAGVFFVITFVLSVLYAHRSDGGSALRRELMRGAAAKPAASAAAVPGASATPVAAAGAPATQSPAPAPSTSAKPSDLAVGAVAQQPSATASPSASAVATPPRVP